MALASKFSTNKLIVSAFLCGMAYALLFGIHAARGVFAGIPVIELILVMPSFESPMYFVMPLFGFFSIFLLVDWINDSFKTKMGFHPVFPLAFFLLSLGAFYVSLYWYIANFASLQGIEMSLDLVDFWGRLQTSSFMLFAWAGVFGWVARFVVEKINL